ncbi:type II toxin-antitoxin system PemK/MazF family toxin [Microbacterium sp.]|uniref:type II toxin-antitoxin system PemK/MazF family toxin n=1 Tax=Microbacterium sp. TaxID=51671 RepID=UPI0039E6BFAC
MVIARGDAVWVDFGSPRGSEPAKIRPAIVVQADWLLASNLNTVVVVPLTSNTSHEAFPGNVRLPVEATGLDKDSVAIVAQVGPVSREYIEPFPIGRVPTYLLAEIDNGIRRSLGL